MFSPEHTVASHCNLKPQLTN